MRMICFGNLSIRQLEKRLGITLRDDHRALFESTKVKDASIPIATGQWFCFSHPLIMCCYDKKTQMQFYNILRQYPATRGHLAIRCAKTEEANEA